MNIEKIEKRVRRYLRTKNPIKKGEKILIIDDGSITASVGAHMLRNIIKGLPVEIKTAKSLNSAKKYSKVIIPWSLEDECGQFLKMLFEKKKQKKLPQSHVKLLMSLTDDEIKAYAKANKLEGKPKPKTKLNKMLDRLEKRYPGYKFSLLNSAKALSS